MISILKKIGDTNLSLSKLAKECDLSVSVINRFMGGEGIGYLAAKQIANYFNTPMEEIEAESKEKAIEEGIIRAKEEGVSRFYIGVKEDAVNPTIDAEEVIERIQVNMIDEYDEVAMDYLDEVTKEQKEELEENMNKVLSNWIEKHKLEPWFYKVTGIEKIEVPYTAEERVKALENEFKEVGYSEEVIEEIKTIDGAETAEEFIDNLEEEQSNWSF